MPVIDKILEHKIIAIVRGANPADVLKIAEALYAGGIRLIEVTMNSSGPLAVIEELSNKMGDKMLIGAGTVLDVATARAAITAGAKFILSPIVAVDVIKAAKDSGAIAIPGAHTATEIFNGHKNGGDIIKVFPATSPDYIKNILGPLPYIPLLPTGGVNLENIKQYQNAGAVGFGIGSSLVNTQKAVTKEYLAQLTASAKKYVQAIAANQ
jgi:2-dehydro-3-deoxyphosphogluconate aldolase/(4S)-4-hydroxy-2-oxoglutarate aldolase